MAFKVPGFQTKGIIEIPLETFGGRVTEMAPTDLPEGVSPDEQDNTYVPGAVLTRPCLQRVLSNGPANTAVTYQKSCVFPTGVIRNLYLFSNGQLMWEDPFNAPGIGNLLFTAPAGSYAKSATMFGREFIAINDTLHGATIPLQWDGTNLDRVTQDGPGTCPIVTSLAPTPAQLAASPNTLTRNANTVTANIATPVNPPLQVGYQVQISNVPDSNSTTVNQSMTSTVQNLNGSGNWGFNSNEYRSNFNPGTSALANLVFQGFGFSIPSAATILGVSVTVGLISQSATAGTVSQVALYRTNAPLGTTKTPGTNFTTTLTNQTYGSAGDSWGDRKSVV